VTAPLAPSADTLSTADAEAFARRFECLAEPTRVRLLHAVAVAGRPVTVGELTEQLGTSQSTCSHHVRRLADAGFLTVRRDGTTTLVTVDPTARTAPPNAADVLLGLLIDRPSSADVVGVLVRELRATDWPAVRRIYGEGIATRNATFETEVPSRASLEAKWLAGHRWVAEIDGEVAGWAAATPVSPRACYSGVAETSVYVGAAFRGRGVGRALLARQTSAADAGGLWTLQTAIFPENLASLALHRAAGFRTLGVRERVAEHHGVWRDTVLMERRSPAT
jgi:L-amino acid N-acyltransferase YncA